MTVGVWIPLRPAGRPGAPRSWALGRAVAEAGARGVQVVLGEPDGIGTFSGYLLAADEWHAVAGVPVRAVYDRFPSVSRRADWEAGLERLRDVPAGNGGALLDLCTDKLACQRALEAGGVAMPPVEGEPGRFQERLAAWGAAYLKPRHGSLGEGVTRVTVDDPLPIDGDFVLQRAVPPLSPWAGVCLRVLVQRGPEGRWAARSPVVRRSAGDPVVNAARGAELVPADDELAHRAGALAVRCAGVLDETVGGGLELGVDLVVGEDGDLWPIEVNGRPRGRLLALAERWPERFAGAHLEALVCPLLTLASDAARGVGAPLR